MKAHLFRENRAVDRHTRVVKVVVILLKHGLCNSGGMQQQIT